MNWRGWLAWAGFACWGIALVWFLLMATLPEYFPWTPDFSWFILAGFVPGVFYSWGQPNDELHYFMTSSSNEPTIDTVTHVSLDHDAIDDD